MRLLRFVIALPVIALMIVFAKAAQFAAVDAFGADLGFGLASMLGGGPVLAFYYWAAKRYPKLNTYGLSRG
jgi:hypothetical protein